MSHRSCSWIHCSPRSPRCRSWCSCNLEDRYRAHFVDWSWSVSCCYPRSSCLGSISLCTGFHHLIHCMVSSSFSSHRGFSWTLPIGFRKSTRVRVLSRFLFANFVLSPMNTMEAPVILQTYEDHSILNPVEVREMWEALERSKTWNPLLFIPLISIYIYLLNSLSEIS